MNASDVRGGRDWWSLQQIERPALPLLLDEWSPNDAFILNSYADDMSLPQGPINVPYCDFYDLWLLQRRHNQYSKDNSDSRETMVDTLLASSHFGEPRASIGWISFVLPKRGYRTVSNQYMDVP